MPTFVFTYRMPRDYVAEQPEAMDRWATWFDNMGDSVSDRGSPVYESTELGTCGAGTRLGGYSFVTADDLEAAVAVAKGSPALEVGDGVEVGAVTVLDPDRRSSGRG